MPRLLLAALASLAVALAALPAAADERITHFGSNIEIREDATLRIVETIAVRAEGKKIRRGIYRDFPTEYEDRLGNRVRVRFDVVSVRRNDVSENWSVEKLRNGVRVRIGRANHLLQHGAHVYEIIYRTTRQLGFFSDFDELYWNATGNGWGFAIDEAVAVVHLPPGAAVLREAAYTGHQGQSGRDFAVEASRGTRVFRTTRTLAPGEGLTIAVAWPKDFVTSPTGSDRVRWFLADNAPTGLALIGTLLVLAYYLMVWHRFGRDPEGGAIIPRFEPPADLSPAATRFIRLMAFDKKAFSAALIDMAVRGFSSIEEHGNSYRIVRRSGASLALLSKGEQRVAKKLFRSGSSIELDNENHIQLGKAVKSLRESLAVEYEKAHFRRNSGLFGAGVVLSAVVAFIAGSAGGGAAALVAGALLAVVCSAVIFVVLHFWGDDTDPTFKVMPFRALPGARAIAVVMQIGFFALFMGMSGLGAAALDFLESPVLSFVIALLGGLNIFFFFLLKRPTRAGRSIMDEIEGFRMYLSVAEEERLNLLNPPEKTPELFEKYLPYALALDVESEWSEKFAAVLAAASAVPGDERYRPTWYHGHSWRPGRATTFTSNLGSSLSSAVASSVSPPGSSSGSGGGGFSGGGGGGGGGGGW